MNTWTQPRRRMVNGELIGVAGKTVAILQR
jgi:hypothetical protein